MMDFINIPPKALPSFMRGYEQESGEKIDPAMMLLTEISLQVDQANACTKNSPEHIEMVRSIENNLSKVAPYLDGVNQGPQLLVRHVTEVYSAKFARKL